MAGGVQTDATVFISLEERQSHVKCLENLVGSEKEQVYFLCYHLCSRNDQDNFLEPGYVIKKAGKEPLPDFITKVSREVNINEIEFTKYLLYMIKRFDLLKTLNMCKHMAQIKYSVANIVFSFMSPFWELLFYICENITESEFEILAYLINGTKEVLHSKASMEGFLIHLYKSKQISKTNLSVLSDAFKEMKLDFLNEKILKYNGNLSLSYYSIDSIPAGMAVIINNYDFTKTSDENENCSMPLPDLKNRIGTEKDEEKLIPMWEGFGLKVIVYKNLTAQEIKATMENIALMDHSKYSMFVCTILTHGERGGIYGSDKLAIKLEDLLLNFTRLATSLCRKPKLFFIQACQGKEFQTVQLQMDSSVVTNACSPVVLGDTFWAVATVPNYVSYRSATAGTIFIGTLVEVFKEYGGEEDLSDLMTRIIQKVSNILLRVDNCLTTQVPIFQSTFRYKFKFKRNC